MRLHQPAAVMNIFRRTSKNSRLSGFSNAQAKIKVALPELLEQSRAIASFRVNIPENDSVRSITAAKLESCR